MAENVIRTRLQLKYDTYANWTKLDVAGIGGNLVLGKGEIGLCEIPTGGVATTAPTVLFKVGNGELPFHNSDPTKCLKWASALAADVYAWAKKENPDWTDFPALPIEVIDEGTGKFVTDFTYVDNKLTITRSDVYWTDVKDTPDFALKSEIPTSVGVMSVTGENAVEATGSENVTVKLKLDDSGNVTLTQSTNGLKANVDTGVHSVELSSGTNNGTVKLTVDGTETDNIAVKGLQDAAFTTIASLNATAKGYADEVENKLPTSADYGVLSIAGGDDTITVGGTAQNPTVAVAPNKFDAHGAAAAVADDLAEHKEAFAEYQETVTNALNDKVANGTYATDKEALEDAIALKADQTALADYYTKTEADGKFADAEAYAATKAQVDNFFSEAGAADVMDTLTEIVAYVEQDKQGAIDLAADVATAKSDAAAAVGTANAANTTAGAANVTAGEAKVLAQEAKEAATNATTGAAASASAAAKSAEDAADFAEAADNSATLADEAKQAAVVAQGAAEGAQGAAESARDAAIEAKNGAVSAQSLAEDAQEAAEAAKADAEAAKSAADASAQGAAESATVAGNAQTAAETAQSKAETAQAKAEAAQAAAEASNTSATAIATEAKNTADAAKEASDAATEAVEALHGIATSGSIYDVKEGSNASVGTDTGVLYLIFNCGSATEVI